MHGSVVSIFLALLSYSAGARASAYSEVTDPSSSRTLARSLRKSRVDLDNVSTLNPAEGGSIARLVADAVFGSQFVGQSAAAYDEVVGVNWSSAYWFEPRCIIYPTSAHDVSTAMVIVTYLGTKFAIRSGGHNPKPGFAGVGDEGILFDMSRMAEVSLSRDGSVASLGPGGRFGPVQKALNAKGKCDGNVDPAVDPTDLLRVISLVCFLGKLA